MPDQLSDLSVCMLVMNDVRNDSRVQKEAQALAEAGADIVIIGVPKKDSSEPWSTKSFEVRLVERHTPSTHPLWPIRVVSNLRGEHALWQRLERAARVVGPDVVHCHDLDTAWSGMRAARALGLRLVYDAHELYTERTTIVWWRKWILERIEAKMLRIADVVFTANAERAEIMQNKYGVRREMIPLLNVPPRAAWVDALAPEAVAAREATGCERLLIYQGGLVRTRGLDAVVRGFESLPEGYHLVLMGLGEPDASLRAATDAEELQGRIHFWPPVSAGDVPSWAAAADAGIVTYLPDSLNNTFCAPNKLYEYAAAGIPVVGADLPPIRAAIEGSAAGAIFTPGDSDSFAAAVRQLFDVEGSLDSARQGVLRLREQANWETEAKKLVRAYAAAERSDEYVVGA